MPIATTTTPAQWDTWDGVCHHEPLVQGTPCPDVLYCNGIEICNGEGSCVAGTPPYLSDHVPCTDDQCDEENDRIVHLPNNDFCQDGLYCNGAEICDTYFGCQPGEAIDPDEGISCTEDHCDEGIDFSDNYGEVTHTPARFALRQRPVVAMARNGATQTIPACSRSAATSEAALTFPTITTARTTGATRTTTRSCMSCKTRIVTTTNPAMEWKSVWPKEIREPAARRGTPLGEGDSCDEDPDDCYTLTCQSGECTSQQKNTGDPCGGEDDPYDCLSYACNDVGQCLKTASDDCTACG